MVIPIRSGMPVSYTHLLITGWYGMNFKDMPGLEGGYPGVVVLSVIVVLVCVFIFKRKNML